MFDLSLKDFPEKIYNITDFGAISCDRLQTENIQKAIDSCFLNGGGRVVIPNGIFLTGGLRLRSNVALYLESGAILKGSINPEDYTGYVNDEIEPIDANNYKNQKGSVFPFSRWNNAIIRVIDAKKVAIIGEKGSYIDGGNCFDASGEEGYRGPHAIDIQRSEDILLDGYSIVDSANWAHAIFITQNIVARNLTVYGGHDGLDIRTCDNVVIEKCNFYTGDDGIAGFDNCDVVIRDCVIDCACNDLRFGGNNVLVENCRCVSPSRYGHRYKLSQEERERGLSTNENCRHNTLVAFSYYCDFRAEIRKTPGNIVIRNCEFENVDSLFSLEFDGEHIWCSNRSLESIVFENCKVKNVCEPIHIHGDENEPLNFTLNNVEMSARKGFEKINVLEAINYSEISFNNVALSGYDNPTFVLKSKGVVNLDEGSNIQIKETV